MTCIGTLVKHCVCFLAFLTWLLGSIIIAFTLWILSTSSNAKNFFSGTLPITYVTLVLGLIFFLIGLLGWMGSYRRGGLMLKMFLFLCVMTIASEIGGIISLSILRTKVTDIVEEGWKEINQKTRNIIQSELHCCGLTGPEEFSRFNEVMDNSCYLTNFRDHTRNPEPMYHEEGCKDKLIEWIYKHKLIWISIFGGFLLFQVITVLFTVSAINHLKSRSSSMESLDEPNTITYM